MVPNSPQVKISFIEDYANVKPEEIKKKLTEITQFIEQIHAPSQHNQDFDSFIAEFALKHFKSLNANAQQQVFYIAKRLTDQDELLCCESNLPTYQRIIKLWVQFSYLPIAIGHIFIFLTPARFSTSLSEQQLERAQCLIAFAVKHFKWLDENHKQSLQYLSNLMNTCPPLPEFINDSQLKMRYQLLRDSLQNCPDLLSSPPPIVHSLSPISSLNVLKQLQYLVEPPSKRSDVNDYSIIFEKKNHKTSLQDQMKREQEELKKTLQIKQICRLSHDIVQLYFPLSWLGSTFQQQQFIQDFDRRFPPVARQLFFQPPSPVAPLQFEMLYQSLVQATQFLRHRKVLLSSQSSQEKIHQLLTNSLERLFLRWQPEQSPINAFFSLITVNSAVQLIDHLVNPDLLYFILDRFFNCDSWDFEDDNDHKTPAKDYAVDDKLTQQLGTALEELAQELILLGEAKWSANLITNILLKIIEVKKNEFAKDLQQNLYQIKSFPCFVTPLFVMHHILFQTKQEKLQATWFEWEEMSKTEKAKRKKAIELRINDLLYQTLLQEVKAHSCIAGLMIANASSIQDFCTTLTQHLWQLFQHEESIKLFIYYLLEGIDKSYQVSEQQNKSIC